MHWKSLILGCALLFSPGLQGTALAAQAEPQPAADAAPVEARPALWKVRDEDTTIYLFGTIHLLKPNIRWFEGPARTAFDESQEVVLEVVDHDEAASQDAILKRALQLTGLPLSNKLDEPAREAYFAALEEHGASPLLFDRVKPWFAAMTLAVLPLRELGYSPESGVDRTIQLAASAAGKQLVALETSDEQIGFFDEMPEGLQLTLLNETIAELPKLPQTIEAMIAAWSAGDPEALAALMNETLESSEEIERILLTDRNARWADWIEARLERPGTVFMAVGAGHLAGKNSVQAMLAGRDIEARLIERKD